MFGNELPRFTAICVSIDRFPQDTAPIRCLPFDGIGARYPAMLRHLTRIHVFSVRWKVNFRTGDPDWYRYFPRSLPHLRIPGAEMIGTRIQHKTNKNPLIGVSYGHKLYMNLKYSYTKIIPQSPGPWESIYIPDLVKRR